MQKIESPVGIVATLPWPSPKLNLNRSKGVHWAATSGLRKKARADAHPLMLSAMNAARVVCGAAGAFALAIAFVQPDRRARDRETCWPR